MKNDMDRKYFPSFRQSFISVGEGVTLNVLQGGTGKEAILLVHGHPETHLMWRFLAEELAKDFTVVMPDIRGYGDSSKPQGLPDHSNYSKRTMAEDLIKVMHSLGIEKFHAAGHDRGARVLHRMAADHPELMRSCTLMDILPTYDMYASTNEEFATKYWHWFFYIQGNGFPEKMLSADPDYFIHYNLNLKIGPAARENFPEEVLREYTRCFALPGTIHGIAEDYRASAGIDRHYDEEDRKQSKIIETPVFAMWGKNGVVGKLWDVAGGWAPYVKRLRALAVPECGHFVPEEQPAVVLQALRNFIDDVDRGHI